MSISPRVLRKFVNTECVDPELFVEELRPLGGALARQVRDSISSPGSRLDVGVNPADAVPVETGRAPVTVHGSPLDKSQF